MSDETEHLIEQDDMKHSTREWDAGEHEGCGKDTYRAVLDRDARLVIKAWERSGYADG